jgi:hypothetical protein
VNALAVLSVELEPLCPIDDAISETVEPTLPLVPSLPVIRSS